MIAMDSNTKTQKIRHSDFRPHRRDRDPNHTNPTVPDEHTEDNS